MIVAGTTTLVQVSVAGAVGAAVGVLAGGALVSRGMAQLALGASRRLVLAARVIGGLAGVAGVIATDRAGSWWLLPALLVWAVAVAAAATCDAATQRIPTPLVRQATVAGALLVVVAAAGAGQWQW